MTAVARKKAEMGTAYLVAARHFEQMAKVFASRRAKNPPLLASATLKDFKKSPRAELVAINTVLEELLTQLNRATITEASTENAKDGGS